MIEDFEKRMPIRSALLTEADSKEARVMFHTITETASALSATQLISLCKKNASPCITKGSKNKHSKRFSKLAPPLNQFEEAFNCSPEIKGLPKWWGFEAQTKN